jgi:dihydrofolate reductase
MKLTVTTFLSLDGVMQGPGGPDEDRTGGFEQGGWLAPYADEDMGQIVTQWFLSADAFLLGRRTYEIFAAFWPQVTDETDPVASQLNALPKYVASTTLTAPEWHNSAVITGDVVAEVARLKDRPGNDLQIHGSGGLIGSLMGRDLIDEYRLLVYPVVLGQGRRLFAEGSVPTALRLLGTRTTSRGVVAHTYQPVGRPTYGSVGA